MRSKQRVRKTTDPRSLIKFIEELGWLLQTYDHIDYRALSKFSQDIEWVIAAGARRTRGGELKVRPVQPLVGMLPEFLMDTDLFESNEDIVEFAWASLELEIPRWKKKSRYEIIGEIVCHANRAPDTRIQGLSKLLSNIVEGRANFRDMMAKSRSEGQSWSEVIGRLYNDQ